MIHYTEKCSYVVNLHSTNSGQTHFKGQSAADEKVPLKWDSTVVGRMFGDENIFLC